MANLNEGQGDQDLEDILRGARSIAVVGIKGAAFWGTIMAVLSVIPGVGTALVNFAEIQTGLKNVADTIQTYAAGSENPSIEGLALQLELLDSIEYVKAEVAPDNSALICAFVYRLEHTVSVPLSLTQAAP